MVHVCTTQSIDFLLHYEITVSLIGGKVALSRGGIMRVVWERQIRDGGLYTFIKYVTSPW